ncbi:hypothetical protein XBO1_2530035 [Xenorhabdus bovienii str. oregonense]|uniref:Uncharacterized protein n=1 Tax=Xenorhabdus bovienii str. oregonense TaxID=1398202 RepID=A0A077PBP1_XENBV|nr:hypothetical protein XBO1_2530035 [Xenorhabdus bovienii str. oregonense]
MTQRRAIRTDDLYTVGIPLIGNDTNAIPYKRVNSDRNLIIFWLEGKTCDIH